MDLEKPNGLLAEIIKRCPNNDLVEFLQDELRLPPFKAETLAQRIEKKYPQKTPGEKKRRRKILENPAEEQAPKVETYNISCLSDVEFGRFLRWLLGELGYEVRLDNRAVGGGIDIVAEKKGEAVAITARKYPKGTVVSEAVFLVSEKVRQAYGCRRSIVGISTYFTQEAKEEAEKLGVEIWDRDILEDKIAEVRRKNAIKSLFAFPAFSDSLLSSLLRLEESKDFIIEQRANGKFDLFLAGVKFPLLTFQSEGSRLVHCVFRMKNYQPVLETEGQPLIWTDENNMTFGPNDAEAYDAVTRYLKEFIE